MYSKIVFVCAILFLFQGISGLDNGYYWRVYDGEIPYDAVAAGRDINGLPIYIGQILYADKLLPAKIYYNENKAYYAWGSEQSTTNNVKILCASHPEQMQWVKVKKNEIHMLINHNLVSGGYEPSFTIYIGRAFHKSETLPGRVRTGNKANQNLGLYVTSLGKEHVYDSFEILTYVPDAVIKKESECHSKPVFTYY